MCRAHRYCVGVLLCALAAAAHPPESGAQFGKMLKKAAGQKAEEKAVDQATGQANQATTNSPCIPARPVILVDAVPLTAAQMAKINAGIDAEIAEAETAKKQAEEDQKKYDKAEKEYEKARADYDKRNEVWNACARKMDEENSAKGDQLRKKADASGSEELGGITEEEMTKLGERAQAAAQRVSEGKGTAEDRKTLAEFQARMAQIQGGVGKKMAAEQEASEYNRGADARVEKACGKRPEAPEEPRAPSTFERVSEAGAKAAGVPLSTWRQWREDQIALVTSNTQLKSDAGGGGGAGGGGNKTSKSEADAANQQIKETAGKYCAMRKAGI